MLWGQGQNADSQSLNPSMPQQNDMSGALHSSHPPSRGHHQSLQPDPSLFTPLVPDPNSLNPEPEDHLLPEFFRPEPSGSHQALQNVPQQYFYKDLEDLSRIKNESATPPRKNQQQQTPQDNPPDFSKPPQQQPKPGDSGLLSHLINPATPSTLPSHTETQTGNQSAAQNNAGKAQPYKGQGQGRAIRGQGSVDQDSKSVNHAQPKAISIAMAATGSVIVPGLVQLFFFVKFSFTSIHT